MIAILSQSFMCYIHSDSKVLLYITVIKKNTRTVKICLGNLIRMGNVAQYKKDTARATELGDSLDQRLVILEHSHGHSGADIAKLEQAVAEVAKSNKILNGRLFRAEMTIERQRAEITDLLMRSMRDNIIIRTKGTTYKECREENTSSVFKCFLAQEMHVPNAEKITITRPHRMGQSIGDMNKMMIAKVAFDDDQRRIFDNAKSLKGTQYSVVKQLPYEVEERRQFAWPDYKRAREAKQTAKFIRSHLYVSGEKIHQYDPIVLPAQSSFSYEQSDPTMGFTTESTVAYDHEFDACAGKVTSLQTVRNCLD